MTRSLEDLERQARSLSAKEKAALARTLIEDLDTDSDADAERLWIEEAHRRYDAFAAGELEAHPGDEVMARARRRLE